MELNEMHWKQKKLKRNPSGNNGCRVRIDLRFTIYQMQNFKCQYCGTDLKGEKRNNLHLDHLIPQSKGGKNEPSNLILTCANCNCSRQDKAWESFADRNGKRRIRKWIVSMNTEKGIKEFKQTRKVVNSFIDYIKGEKTPINFINAVN